MDNKQTYEKKGSNSNLISGSSGTGNNYDKIPLNSDFKSKNLVEGVFRSIRAAIMSRNMSHNIGSHVLSYLKMQLSCVGNILDNQLLAELLDKTNNIPKTEQFELPFLTGLGHFLTIIQERQDYIATIATDFIPCFTPVDFKDAVFDGLNPDYRWVRHKGKDNPVDNQSGWKQSNILLNYIARSEGLSRDEIDGLGQLTCKYGYDTDNNQWEIIGGNESEGIDFMRGKQMALPGGMSGRQAIFSIVENIIRNAAKHEMRSKGANLDIIFGLIDGAKVATGETKGISKELLKKLISDEPDIKVEHWEDYWLLTISYHTQNANLQSILEKKLDVPFMDEDFMLVDGDKGIKEIILSAAFLRRQSNLKKDNVDTIVTLLTQTEINAREKGAEIEENGRLFPYSGEPQFVYIDYEKMEKDGIIRYVVPIRKVLPLMVCTEGMNDEDRKRFAILDDDCPWQVCDSIEQFKKEGSKRGFEYYIVANRDIYNQVRPYGTNRIVIWEERDEEMKNYWNGTKEDFIHLMRIVSAMHAGCSVHPKSNDEKIYIDDFTAKTQHSPELDDNPEREEVEQRMWTSSYGTLSDNDRKELQQLMVFDTPTDVDLTHLYRTHHEEKGNYKDYLDNCIAGMDGYYRNKFVEGISGGNSTERLLRREPYTFETYTQHLHTAKSRIAIIDERIFKDIHGREASTCMGEGMVLEDGEMYRSLHYIQKGIDVLAIVPMGDNKNFALIGCVWSTNNDNEHIAACEYCQLATLSFDENFLLSIEWKDKQSKAEFYKKFDYFAIHQGVLDKLYEPFKNTDTKEISKKKLHVTRSLFDEFMKGEAISISKNREDDFLPNFVIHSGRGKCAEIDMPQKLPFVMYAQMSYAVNDCKYNLVQLFDFVRYEND